MRGLQRIGYELTRQRGHVTMTTHRNGEHHVIVPRHDPVKVGTLAGILGAVASHLGLDREELLRQMRL